MIDSDTHKNNLKQRATRILLFLFLSISFYIMFYAKLVVGSLYEIPNSAILVLFMNRVVKKDQLQYYQL